MLRCYTERHGWGLLMPLSPHPHYCPVTSSPISLLTPSFLLSKPLGPSFAMQVHGQAICPAAGLIEMALASLASLSHGSLGEELLPALTGISIQAPVVLCDSTVMLCEVRFGGEGRGGEGVGGKVNIYHCRVDYNVLPLSSSLYPFLLLANPYIIKGKGWRRHGKRAMDIYQWRVNIG